VNRPYTVFRLLNILVGAVHELPFLVIKSNGDGSF